MKQTETLFSERRNVAWTQGLRYFILIASNGGMPILLILAAILFSYAYIAFLSWLPETFPAYVLMAFVMAVVLTKCTVRTFMEKPDVVFLLPLEHRMVRYFRQSLIYSSVLQVIIAAIAMGLLWPLYRVRIGDEATFFIALGWIAVFKLWNVYTYWQELKLPQGRGTHVSFRFIVNLILTGLLFYGGSLALYALIATLMLVITTWYFSRLGKKNRYPWYRLVDLEQKKRNALYTLASFFVDVPHIQQQVKQRRWLSRLLISLPYRQQNGYLYLYMRTFARSGEYLGLYLRLTLVTAVVMAFIPNAYAVVAVYLIGLIFTGVQLPAVSRKHDDSVLLKLYPLQPTDRQQSMSRLVFILLTVQSILLAFVYLVSAPSVLLMVGLLGAGLIFSYVYSFVVLPGRLNNRREA